MKKTISVVMACLLLISFSVPAFAATTPYDPAFVPPVPDFIDCSDGSVAFTCGIDIGNSALFDEVQEFLQNYKTSDKPYFFLLSQGKYNKYNEENNIDYDREFVVYLFQYEAASSSAQYDFGSFSHHGGPRHSELMGSGNTMTFQPLGNKFKFIRMTYDKERDIMVADRGVWQSGYSGYHFTYVLASSPLSGSHKLYPYKDHIGGLSMEIATDYNFASDSPLASDYCERDYDWWLNIKGEDLPPVNPPYNPDKDLNKDTDGDGKPDLNIDTDGDGRADTNIDKDGDGKPDLNVDTDGDGKPDINLDTDKDGKPDLNIDTNGDGKSDTNIDTDNDNIPDLNVDTDKDGKPDLNIDTDGDGKADLNIDTNGDKKPNVNVDTNGDRRPDINVDTNGDGAPDINIDTNGDGKPNLNVDTNGDKKPDINIDTNGDGNPNLNIDTNGDKKPDVNVDTNGDKKPDLNIDTTGDGNADTNVDTDGDGVPDRNVRPGGGSGGSGNPDTWWGDDGGGELTYNQWDFFDPFSFDYKPIEWDKGYNPLEDYNSSLMPDFPGCGVPDVSIKDPFEIPNDIKFHDYVIEFGGK